MKRIVLDASAVMTFFEDRPGAAKVEEIVARAAEGKCELLMSVVNWGEVYYSVWRAKGPAMARKIVAEIGQLPIVLRRRPRLRSQSLPRHQRRRLRQSRAPPQPPLDPLTSPQRRPLPRHRSMERSNYTCSRAS